jgi:SAM-dependent methyltransferase
MDAKRRMTRKYQEEWEKNARLDPLYAILSAPEGRGGQWSREDFFATGDEEIERVFAQIATIGANPARNHRFLDFGCGVGRASQALGRRFSSGIGIDISPRMIELARSYGESMSHITFVQNAAENLHLVESGTISFVYSHIVLQHVSVMLQRAYIGEFGRVLEPGGVAAFQIPVEDTAPATARPAPPLYKRIIPKPMKDQLKRMAGLQTDNDIVTMEMNCLAERDIRALLREAGCSLVAMTYSNSVQRDHNGRLEFFDRDEALARVADGRAHGSLLSGFFFARKGV